MKHTISPVQRQSPQNENRILWLVHFDLHGENRIWWAYFQNVLEIHTCFSEIVRAFPCLEFKSLHNCSHSLHICSHSYPATGAGQHQTEASLKLRTSDQDQPLFPIAPFACDYLASLVKGLGHLSPCAQCKTPANTTTAL